MKLRGKLVNLYSVIHHVINSSMIHRRVFVFDTKPHLRYASINNTFRAACSARAPGSWGTRLQRCEQPTPGQFFVRVLLVKNSVFSMIAFSQLTSIGSFNGAIRKNQYSSHVWTWIFLPFFRNRFHHNLYGHSHILLWIFT